MRQKVTCFTAALLFVVALFPPSSTGGETPLATHWKRPAVAGNFGGALSPKECGACHSTQYGMWKESLHAKSAGPGLMGQLDVKKDPATALSCYFCHSPLLEQQESASKNGKPNPRFDAALQKTGVTCAACHVRNGKVLGPPQYGGLKTEQGKGKLHATEARDFFHKSEFCAACHQLDDGYKINGKLLTNTFGEWKTSRWAKEGLQCQDCHMPDRLHLFKGIHDKETTLRALDFSITRTADGARLSISNTGAGHFFPTYVTPLVVIKAFTLKADGTVVADSKREDLIGRKVGLDLESEEFDTRIPPDGRHEFVYKTNKGAGARVVFEVWVFPDNFYYNLFKSLSDGETAAAKPGLIKKAKDNAESSPYLLWRGEAPM